MARSNANHREPGVIGNLPPHKSMSTTPEITPDEDAPLPIADQFSNSTYPKPQDASLNGIQQDPNAAPARVLQGQGPDPTPEQSPSGLHAPLPSPPKSAYQHQYQSDSAIFKGAEGGDEDLISPSDEPKDVRAEVPEMSAVSEGLSPVEAPTNPIIQNSAQGRALDPVELSSSPPPGYTNAVLRTNGVPQLIPGPHHFNGHTGNMQNEANASSTMALQGAREAVSRKSVPSGQTARPESHGTTQVNSGPVDRVGVHNGVSHNESGGSSGQKEPGARRSFPLSPSKRGSKDDKPKQLQKPDPQTSSLDDGSSSGQKRVDLFLRNHNVPRNPHHDSISTLLDWMKAKLKESEKKEQEFNRQATSLGVHRRDIAKLKADLSSIQVSEESLTKAQQRKQQELENANRTIGNLGDELHKTRQAVTAVQDMFKDAAFERDQAHNNYNQLTEQIKEMEEGYRNSHKKEMLRVGEEHAGQINALEYQMKQERDQAESRMFTMTQEHAGQINALKYQMKQERDQAESRMFTMTQEHRKALDRKDAEIMETDARHEISMTELQQNHDDAMDLQKRAFQDLRRHMASYNNTGGYTAISDDEFRGHFQLLTRRINNLIKWVSRPQTYALDEYLDPNGFLARNAQQGGRNWPKFVRSVCWRSIVRGFYCRQLGFGAFGNEGEGFEELDHLRQLFALPNPKDPSGLCATLPNTKELNTWRASFFDALLKTIRHGTIGQTDNKYIRLFRKNIEAVTGELVSSLQQVAQIRLDPGIWDEVADFVEGLGMLALEMGSQRAHVYIETCEYGENIAVGDRFRDDADLGFERLTVDLMTQPCLRREGDGREDLTTQRTIVKGDFVALKPGGLV
ncbi:hypothetical protein G7Z17_g1668 [Cylindrodendrum hubeiense]|uniref:Uncharacterized protein n=1 Tax=Cylindrodendrum hubeiense TaxID=595255 RepID=A0A9P5HMJ7_9HYPO|nr:hypothetical protein G7Z17_g1668 [Cylindrodendrum hubeiense]